MCTLRSLLMAGGMIIAGVVLCSCKREERGFRVEPPSANTIEALRVGDLLPGPSSNEIATNLALTNAASTNPPATNSPGTNAANGSSNLLTAMVSGTNLVPSSTGSSNAPVRNEYEENAYALSEGQHLYNYFNCVGCHAHGGGGMGPALMDDQWIYGHNPEQIFATIVEGRPNGMPAFRGRIPDYQVWEIAAYVRSLSGLVGKDAAPGRTDHMKGKPPENSKEPEQPKNSNSR
jgi:cytochrome c oxidase cbb3-type subunit 3